MKIGVVTIGQSPRPDIIGEINRVLGQGYEVLEGGALDDYTPDEIRGMDLNYEHGLLVTRLRDGSEAKITHELIDPLIQKRIKELDEQTVSIILLVCTGKFPVFESKALIVTPSEIIRGVTRASIKKGRLANVLPSIQQIGGEPHEREEDGLVTYFDSASPYGPIGEVERLGERLAKKELDLILLNCMGFDHKHKKLIKEITGKPVIQSSSIVARVLKELVT